jgi:hypothetical protein
MKASDWAKKIVASGGTQEEVSGGEAGYKARIQANLPLILKDFFQEIMTVARAGGSTSNIVAYDNALKQQEAKFRAVCRLTNILTPSMWTSLLRQYFPRQIVAEVEYQRKQGNIGYRPKKRQQRQRVA